MPRTYEEAFKLKAQRVGWVGVPPLECPDLGGLVLWPEQPWHVNAGPVDHLRSAMLEQVDADVLCRTSMYKNVRTGVPYQLVNGVRGTQVWPIRLLDGLGRKLPLPDIMTRVGDPLGSKGDLQWFGIDTAKRKLYEASSIGKGWRGWQAGTMLEIAYDRPFSESRSVCAGRIPMLALLPRPEEMLAGYIPTALAMVGPASPRFHAPARASDGLFPDHPIEYGDRFVLDHDAAERALARVENIESAAVVNCLREGSKGAIFNDRTGPHYSFRLPVDPRISVQVPGLRLSDFRIVRN